MADPFSSYQPGLDAPPSAAFTITPNDTTDMAIDTRAIYVGTGGDIKVDMVGGGTVVFSAVPQGDWFPCRAKRVYATGTTASGLIGGY